MNAAEIGIVPPSERRQSAFDLFLIFAAANIVATTLQVGASLVPEFTLADAMGLILAGSLAGSALVAALAPVGPRLGAPSVIAARAALGFRGAAVVAIVLYVTNFAWIALNNVIAASACARVAGGKSTQPLWAFGLGILATAVVAGGPRLVRLADRIAVPLLLVVGIVLSVACLRLPIEIGHRAPSIDAGWMRGLDVVIGYQVSWILMFADYSRYTASARHGALAVFLGLALTSLWFMPIGAVAAVAAGSSDPGAMLEATGTGMWGAVLLTVANVTTNFVNIYLSSLAWRSLLPRVRDQVAIWSIGLTGSALSLSGAWLDRYADLMLVLGGILVPVGGVLVAHFFILHRRGGREEAVELYDPAGRYNKSGGIRLAGAAAWICGTIVYYASTSIGGAVPSLVTAIVVYSVLGKATEPDHRS
ncbi:MAG: cytosine permease [Acidobacteria bacterium]|nr:cytosine permease [Acidobacteriota bacterium]